MDNKYAYIENFSKLGYGLFVHFGLYSLVGKGEWFYHIYPDKAKKIYPTLLSKFKINKKDKIFEVNGDAACWIQECQDIQKEFLKRTKS